MKLISQTLSFGLRKQPAQARLIYDLWLIKNTRRHTFFVLSLAMYVMAIMILFDHLLVAHPVPFISSRLIVIAVLLIALSLVRRRRTQLQESERHNLIMLILGPLLYHFQYLYFVFYLHHEKTDIYFVGLLLGIFYVGFVLHRFKSAQYLYSAVAIASTLPCAIWFQDKSDLAYTAIVCILASAFMFSYFRRDFVENLYSVYSLLRLMVPARVAEVLAVSHETTDATNRFRPKEHFTVCLCSDWRSFQKIVATRTSDEVSGLLEGFYDIVLLELEKLVPSNNFYFSWTADELFIVFFDENEKRQDVLTEALQFANVLVTKIFDESVFHLSKDIRFDVGLAAGTGLLGLQGPKTMKKTTITGEVAGRAKRFQEEAKHLRKAGNILGPPVLVMDETLVAHNKEVKIFDELKLRRIRAVTKDIEGITCYYWWNERRTSRGKKKVS